LTTVYAIIRYLICFDDDWRGRVSPSLDFKFLETAPAPKSFFNVPAHTGLKRPVRSHHYAFTLAGRLDQQYRSNSDIPVAGRSSFFSFVRGLFVFLTQIQTDIFQPIRVAKLVD
jgi:hypothetical protein